MKRLINLAMTAALIAVVSGSSVARTNFEREKSISQAATPYPAWCSVNHDIGKIGFTISNDGTLGNLNYGEWTVDCFTGKPLLQGEYPIGSNNMYFWGGALWIGAVVGTDTLVSTGADGWAVRGSELNPDFYEYGGGMQYRSTIDPDKPTFEGAISEQDYIAVYRDTCKSCQGGEIDEIEHRAHIPINIEVTQRSFAWSYPVAEDFILIDYSIKNIGNRPLEDLYIGLLMDLDIHDLFNQGNGALDDISGLWSGTYSASNGSGCQTSLDVEMPWSADNDGDLNQQTPVWNTVPHVSGIRLLDMGGNAPQTTFNWWVSNNNSPQYDWGPMRRVNPRDFSTGGMGSPSGDNNKYYLLSNGDRDYDQYRTATIPADDSIWLPPPVDGAQLWSTGQDTRYLVSSGSINLEPGQSVPLTLAFVCGENLHSSGANFLNLPYNPDAYFAGLNFSDFISNGVWAGWVYDNPGIDTDSDGYAGQYQLCGDDTLWYKGDGVPDWRAASRPMAPVTWVEPRDQALYVRWNGFQSENQLDWASRQTNFEGYRLYLSTTGVAGSFAAIGSYDIEDYYRYYWDFDRSNWTRSLGRLTLEESRCHYAPSGCTDQSWYPLDFTRQAPYVMPGFPDSLFYFEPVMTNSSIFGLETPFLKRFPNAPCPGYGSPSDVPSDSTDVYLTEDGFFKYYEYEMLLEDLIVGQPYWVSVTTFDFGSMAAGAAPAESPILGNSLKRWPAGDCCNGTVGNVNCDAGEEIGIGDVSVLIDFLFITGEPLCCLQEADVNRSGGATPIASDISLSDIYVLIDYLFVTGPSLGLPSCQ